MTEIEIRHRRVNRRTYAVEVLVIFAAYLAIDFSLQRLGLSLDWVDIVLTAVFCLYIARAFSGRMHDIGRSDYWTALPLGIFLIGWLVPSYWHDAPLWAEVAAPSLWFAALLSPILFEGDHGINRFGRPPSASVELAKITNVG